MTPEQENKLLKELLYCTKRSCNNCGKVNCENFQRQRIDCCGLWVSYKDYIKQQEEKIADLKANFDYVLEGKDLEIKELGTRCNQLLKDKGNLIDELDNQKVAYETLKLHDQEEIGMLKNRVAELEKENAELKEQFKICEGNADTYYNQLAQAKEIIKEWLRLHNSNTKKTIIKKSENFLKEIE